MYDDLCEGSTVSCMLLNATKLASLECTPHSQSVHTIPTLHITRDQPGLTPSFQRTHHTINAQHTSCAPSDRPSQPRCPPYPQPTDRMTFVALPLSTVVQKTHVSGRSHNDGKYSSHMKRIWHGIRCGPCWARM